MILEERVCTDQGPNSREVRQGSANLTIDLRYLGESHIRLIGARTGKIYRFSSSEQIQPVDLRDANFLLACNLFTIA
jgi:hypothetical protein